MKIEGKLKKYLSHFLDFAIKETVNAHPQVVDVKVLGLYPRRREIWCVFVYHPEIEELESRVEMWTDFWESFCKKREIFYSEFKKAGHGHIILYPLFMSKHRLESLLEESSTSS